MGEMTALRAIVRGRVQGVYYRAFTERLARKLGLSGWVRNLPDRSVEVYAEGDKERLEELLKALHIGPPGAWVDDITTEWLEHTGKLRGFSVTG